MITAIDIESFLIAPGLAAPPLVCVSWCNGVEHGLLNHTQGVAFVRELLRGGSLIVGHNIVYDFGVLAGEDESLLALIFKAYEQDRIRDTGIREKLVALAEGTMKGERRFNADGEASFMKKHYRLSDLVLKYTGRVMNKETPWRLRFGTLKHIPIRDWPEEARQYAEDDAKDTFAAYIAQNNHFTQFAPKLIADGTVVNECDQAKAAWALNLMRIWGLRTEKSAVEELRSRLREEITGLQVQLKESGLIRQSGKKLSKSMSAIRERIVATYGNRIDEVPRTEKKGLLQTSSTVLRGSRDPLLIKLCEYEETEKILSSFIPTVEQGIKYPITPSYNELVESGRTSCARPNVQQLPRDGDIRGCFIPRTGFVYVSCDYASLEMCSLGQVCLDIFGESAIADAMKAGRDPHLLVTAQLFGMSYDEIVALYKAGDKKTKEYRQYAKPVNYGFPGGMGAETFVDYAAKQEVFISLQQSQKLKSYWLKTWPEMKKYFNWVGSALGGPGEGEIRQLRSNRVRYVFTYTSACNTFFQGLAADGAKEACFRVAKECYVDLKTPLFGCRPVAFLHDEILMEAPEWKASDAAHRLAKVMVDGMQMYIPDIPIKAEPVLMRRWYKDAKPVYVDGRLVPWEPKAEEKAA